MNESPQQYFLNEADTWIDLYGHSWRANSHIPAIAHKAKKLPDSSLDLIKHLALYTGWLWKYYPAIFTSQAPDLVTPPDNITDLEGTQYDKAVLEILADRCARFPRWEDINRAAGWYLVDVESPDPPNNSDEVIIESIIIRSSILLHEDESEQLPAVLDILLTDAWELYLRAWKRANP
nr:MAG TPA: hypothetical protein [Caudoviricetes sp.]